MNETRVVPVELPTDVHDAMAMAVQHAIATSNPCAYWTIARAAFDALLSAAPPTADVQVSEMVRTAPARIWIDVSEDEDLHDEPSPNDLVEDMTWSITRGSASTVEYVRADVAGIADAQGDDASELRKMLAFAYSGANLYGDDGCLEDNSTNPCIDYINDPVAVIRSKIRERGMRQLEAQAQPRAVPGE